MEFIELLDQAAAILQKKELDDDYAVFRERYVKIRVYLDIVRMIDHGDDDELQDAIAAVNRYYQENIYEESSTGEVVSNGNTVDGITWNIGEQ